MTVQLTKVTKSFVSPGGVETPVLKSIDLKIEAGEFVAITGPSGCGKSTLLNVIGTLDRPTTGLVVLDGRDVSSLSDEELARVRAETVGIVFQNHHLLPQCNVLENVLVPALVGKGAAESEERARKLLDRVELSHRLTHRPAQLSGGECQRAAVVRALINSPKILLADEPTGSLDRESAAGLVTLLEELNREEGVALIVVTHAADLAERATRTLKLADGVITHEG